MQDPGHDAGTSFSGALQPEIDALRPVTIRQMLDAEQAYTGAKFTIDGIEVQFVGTKPIAHVASITVTDTKVEYQLEDGTSQGRILVEQWRSEAANYFEELDNNGQLYLRVLGEPKRFRGRNRINVSRRGTVRKVTNPHEPYFHLLEAFFATQSIEIGQPPSPVMRSLRHLPSAVAEDNNQVRSSNPHLHEPPQSVSSSSGKILVVHDIRNDKTRSSPVHSREITPQALGRDPLSHLTALERGIILQILNAPQSQDGVPVTNIARGIATVTTHQGVTSHQIENALDVLIDGGYIEPTVDASHYKATRKCTTSGIYALSVQ